MKCPYCARRLSLGGLECRACRRYILRWPHIIILVILGVAVTVFLLEVLSRAF